LSYNLSRKLFSVAGVDFCCEGFLKSLEFHGVLTQWEVALRTSIMSSAYADKKDQKLDCEVIQSWSREFRYSMDLLGVAELTGWLNLNGFEKEDLESHFIRRFWVERFGDVVDASDCQEKIEDRLIFSELYFSESFSTLLKAWQKRILAWYDVNGADFPGSAELEKNFEEYSQKLLLEMKSKEWLKIYEQDLTTFTLNCIVCKVDPQETFKSLSTASSLETKVKELGLESFEVQEFYKDLPEEISSALKYISKKALAGPVKYNGQTLILHLSAKQQPSTKNKVINDFLFDGFSNEVWKTLTVKYVR
jgi:hypothetical protein